MTYMTNSSQNPLDGISPNTKKLLSLGKHAWLLILPFLCHAVFGRIPKFGHKDTISFRTPAEKKGAQIDITS